MKMTDGEFNNWVTNHNIPPHTVEIISKVRNKDPYRRVTGGMHNVAGRYPSEKMNCMIQFDSHTNKNPQAVFLENDDNVIEYYDQPVPIKLVYRNQKNRNIGLLHTADYFMLMTNGTAGWVECKLEKDLLRLSEKSPNRYGYYQKPI